MKLTYETGTATLIQFIVLGLLNIATGSDSIITTCHQSSGDCLSNAFTSFIFYILIVGWFGVILVLGYLAQERRNKRLAQLLIAAEALVALIALFNAKHHTDYLGLLTSLVDVALALWIISLAWRLMRAGGKRIPARRRGRAGSRVNH